MKTLKRNIDAISFFEREKYGGQYVRNKCGRDFLYYALNYYYPEKFNNTLNNPTEIDGKKLFGTPVPAWLAWTQIQFWKVPQFLRAQNLQLFINSCAITSFANFAGAILSSKTSFAEAIRGIERAVDEDTASGIDISLGMGGLLDHVVFVYGYDTENLYVVDTHKVESLGYTATSGNKLLFKLAKEEIQKRWTRFGRVWKVVKM
ncbi:MAG: hypothetical protein HYW65_02450 [Candidatus Liptonbacteria bacterium]|nr:hypothetical protein [Candidatus Liptonbacteria bacterium]